MHPIELIAPTSLPPSTPPGDRRWLDRCLTAAMLTCFALSGWFWSQQPITDAAIQPQAKPITRTKLDEAKPSQQLLTRSIEQVQLGQRLVGKNPLRHETSLPSNIHPKTWRTIRLTMTQDGVHYDLTFLRSLDWLQAAGAATGGTIELHLPEMGLSGPALVESILSCPTLEADDGSGRMVVTGTIQHVAGNIIDLGIAALAAPIGVTDTHLMWSEDRQDFVPAGQLQIGESLRSFSGTLSHVTRINPRTGPPQLVYNLEVDGEHVYCVSSAGVLAHNACPISMDDALDRAQQFMQPGVTIHSVNQPSGVQFIQTFIDANGDTITRRVGFDINPANRHVQQLGPHLNLQTQINGVPIRTGPLADPHFPIDPRTIIPGDF